MPRRTPGERLNLVKEPDNVPVCPVCEDRGIYMVGEAAVPCRCMREKALFNRLKAAHLTGMMRQHTFERFNLEYYSRQLAEDGRSYREIARLTLEAAKEFVARVLAGQQTDGLLLTGPVGTGKTYVACCIANRLLDEGVEVLFLVVPDFLDRIRATYDLTNPEFTEVDLTDAAKSAPVLILDDLGAHHYTAWARQKIYSLINHRLNHQLPVVVTTNISLESLAEHLGERTSSRLFQICRPCRLLTDVDIRIARRLGRVGAG
jgi:DNA replication protein DnaC